MEARIATQSVEVRLRSREMMGIEITGHRLSLGLCECRYRLPTMSSHPRARAGP